MINRVKFSSCLQRLKQSYLLTHYQYSEPIAVFFRKIIHLPLTARPNALLPNLYAYTFVLTRAISPCHICGPCLSVCVPLSPDRGLTLSTNIVLHVRSQISTKRPPPFIVGLFRSAKIKNRCYALYLLKNIFSRIVVCHSRGHPT